MKYFFHERLLFFTLCIYHIDIPIAFVDKRIECQTAHNMFMHNKITHVSIAWVTIECEGVDVNEL